MSQSPKLEVTISWSILSMLIFLGCSKIWPLVPLKNREHDPIQVRALPPPSLAYLSCVWMT